MKLTSPEEQHAVLSELDDLDAVKTIVPIGLDGVLSDDEKKLYDIISTSSSGGLNDLDGGERIPEEFSLLFKTDAAEDSTSVAEDDGSYTDTPFSSMNAFSSPPLIILALSCVAAFLAMGCIAVAVYTTRFIHKQVLGSNMAWEMLPRLEKQDCLEYTSNEDDQGASNNQSDEDSPSETDIVVVSEPREFPPQVIEEKEDLIVFDTESSDMEDEVYDEKFRDAEFFDAEERPSSVLEIRPEDLPRIVLNKDEEYPDPDFLPLPQFSTPFSTPPPSPPHSPLRRPSQMREANLISSPVSKPAWSLRAADAPALGLMSSSLSSRSPTPRLDRSLSRSSTPSLENLAIPGALYPDLPLSSEPEMREVEIPGRRRAYRAPVPELDIAFAMQLRPGLGLGADPAWLVRFLMAMFGWMTVLIGGNGGNGRERRAIA